MRVTWEAFEDAGQPVHGLAGSNTGVFVGLWLNDYEARLFEAAPEPDFYMLSGTGRYAASGRLSYTFGLEGPSLTVDTACSSSLVAVHLACLSLRSGECGLAVAGGANVILQPQVTIAYSQSRMIAADGRCKFGDAQADGYVRSEGAGVVVLKRLEEALADGDPIYAVIAGSAVNNDGKGSQHLTTPSQHGQEALLRRAYEDAGIAPGAAQYVEAHGTGTSAGDPVELQALGRVLAEGRPAGSRCFAGSVKTNIGHTEGAAGVAGLIKTALALHHRVIPASLHCNHLNPEVPWNSIPLCIARQQAPWPSEPGSGIAGVSSFGIAGTNAHVVLREAPARAGLSAPRETPRAILLPVSARSAEAVQALARRYAEDAGAGGSSLRDLGYTAARRRSHHEYRIAAASESRADLRERLLQSAEREPGRGPRGGKVVFVFPGQGSQWSGMCRELLAREPIFRESLERCELAMQPFVDWSLREQLTMDETAPGYRLAEVDCIQPTLLSVEIALAELWRSWGITPDAVIGHSMGEAAAAFTAGALSLSDAMRVICLRSKLLRRTSGKGAMAVVELSIADTAKALEGFDGLLSIAVSNSATSTVVSGDAAAIERLLDALEKRGVFCRPVRVDVASHSPQMDPLKPELFAALQPLRPMAGAVPMYSTARSVVVDGSGCDAAYWVDNLRQPVMFSKMTGELLAAGHDIFIEMGPHPILLPAIEQAFQRANVRGAALPSLRRREPEQKTMLSSLGRLYELGCAIDWQQLYPEGECVPLPPYAWQEERFWYEATAGGVSRKPAAAPVEEPETPAADGFPSDWFYELQWKEQAATPASPEAGSGARRWLILADGSGIGARTAEQLRARDQECVVVRAGGEYEGGIDPADPQALASLFAGEAFDAMVHLWSLDIASDAEMGLRDVDDAQTLGFDSVVHLLHASQGKAKLWIVTRNAQPAGAAGEPLSVLQAPVWGLGRGIALEQPDAWGGLIDIDDGDRDDLAARLLDELGGASGEDQVALRGGTRYVARLASCREAQRKPLRLRPDASYLIIGGFGALGRKVTRWMAESGARHLILVGRTGVPERSQWANIGESDEFWASIASIRHAEGLGAVVRVERADVGDAAAMAELFDRMQRECPPLAGIFHCAMSLEFRSLAEMNPTAAREMYRAKVRGGWILHELSRLAPLDHFVLFSSASAQLGAKFAAHYSAANQFLDALAHSRKAMDLPALSIDWGEWDEIRGLTDVQRAYLERTGRLPMESHGAFAAMSRLMATGAVQCIVARMNTNVLKTAFEERGRRAFLDDIVVGAEPARKAVEPIASLRPALLDMDTGDRREAIARCVIEEIARVLGTVPERIDPRRGLFDMGLDSLMSMELRLRLEGLFERSLPKMFTFNFPTANALTAYLVSGEWPEGRVAATRKTQAAAMPSWDGVSREEASRLLAQELNDLQQGRSD